MGEHTVTMEASVMGHALATHGQPVSSAEVNCLRKVVALVETTVIGSRKGHHKLPGTLIGSVDLPEGYKTVINDTR